MAGTMVSDVELFDDRYRDYPSDVGPVDPLAPLEYDEIIPIWPASDTSTLIRNARMSYDRNSDTLFMRFPGGHRPTFNMRAKGCVDLLVDLNTNEVVGLEIQTFLLRAVREYPPLINALDAAELRGITPDEVQLEKFQVFSKWTLLKNLLRESLGYQVRTMAGIQRRSDHSKQDIVMDYYRNECGAPA